MVASVRYRCAAISLVESPVGDEFQHLALVGGEVMQRLGSGGGEHRLAQEVFDETTGDGGREQAGSWLVEAESVGDRRCFSATSDS